MGSLTKQGSKYSDEDRRRVVVEYFITGSISKVAKSTGIPRRTINDWKNTDWWHDVVAMVRHEKGEEFDANLTKLIDVAFVEAEDRIKNGDFRLVKTKKAIKHEDGSLEVAEDYELKRVPMGGKELVISGATVYDKRQLHRNQPTSIKSESSSLESLTKTFEEIARQVQGRLAKQANSIPGVCEEID